MPVKTLVFEDLSSLGYRTASRESGMDECHAIMVLRRLAQFHSVSVVAMEKVDLTNNVWKNTYLYKIHIYLLGPRVIYMFRFRNIGKKSNSKGRQYILWVY